MIRHEVNRRDDKRKVDGDHKRRQNADSAFKSGEYPHRLNFYITPPIAEITLDQFEQWAIDRLKVLAELESCSFRNRTQEETAAHMKSMLEKYLPLAANSRKTQPLFAQRQKDHYSHFILRLAFSSTPELRRRFARVETALFRHRFQQRDETQDERTAFVASLNLDFDTVSEEEKRELATDLLACTPGVRKIEDEDWFKVNWDRVPELVENRKVLLRRGKAYVPMREQVSLVVAEFNGRLEKSLESTSKAILYDEDERLRPILMRLSKNFATPGDLADSDTSVDGAPINAASIDGLSPHFPLCMRSLHIQLRLNSHLKHYARLQYTLFLKGVGLSLEDCLQFWRASFNKITDDVFNKEYRYNVRHAYGDVGGDSNRRGRGYTPFSCQKILTEHPPGPGEQHGCPYRHYSPENLISLLNKVGVSDRETLKGVREDVDKKRFHIACNRVFDYVHQGEIKKAKNECGWGAQELETIVHPNTYFKRSYLLKHLGQGQSARAQTGEDVEMKD